MTAMDVLGWRRCVRDLYARVRACPDPAQGHQVWRDTRDELFAHHPASPLPLAARGEFSGLPVAAYDADFRFEVEVERAEPGRMDVPTGTDGVVPFDRVGSLTLPALGTLDVWWLGSYGGGLFLPLRDGLAGVTGGTFGGGRYVLDTVKGADLGGEDARLVVDLNFAFNPSCAYDAAWACPLAPGGNTVAGPVAVGELMPTAGWPEV